jgi:hypothetical protein
MVPHGKVALVTSEKHSLVNAARTIIASQEKACEKIGPDPITPEGRAGRKPSQLCGLKEAVEFPFEESQVAQSEKEQLHKPRGKT